MDYKIKRLCTVCGRVHTGRCKAGYAEKQRNSQADKFRNTQLWKRTARAILERDFHCCRVCLERGRLVNRGLSVHHITPLAEDFSLRLDETNLITLCRICHDQLEAGPFSRRGAQLRDCFTREKLRELASTPPISVKRFPERIDIGQAGYYTIMSLNGEKK